MIKMEFGGWSSMGGGVSDWDLQAVVRGYFSPVPPPPLPEVDAFAGLNLLLDEFDIHGSGAVGINNDFDLPELPASSSYTDMHELEEMYKPFFFASQPAPAPAPALARPQRPASSQSARTKRRKSQAKKEVCHVPADGLAADKWAWRKYGQKPIKGSPYPRGYYRCSTSKACPAKKQVERSCTDPTMFVITYTAEHNHATPTHRNSLAGSTRQKLATPPSSAAAQNPAASSSANTSVEEEENEEGCSTNTGKKEVDGSDEYGDEDLMFPSDDMMFMEFAGGSPGGVLDSWFSESSPIDFSDHWFAGVGNNS